MIINMDDMTIDSVMKDMTIELDNIRLPDGIRVSYMDYIVNIGIYGNNYKKIQDKMIWLSDTKNYQGLLTSKYDDLVDYFLTFGSIITCKRNYNEEDNIMKVELPCKYYMIDEKYRLDYMKWLRYIKQIPELIRDMINIINNQEIDMYDKDIRLKSMELINLNKKVTKFIVNMDDTKNMKIVEMINKIERIKKPEDFYVRYFGDMIIITIKNNKYMKIIEKMGWMNKIISYTIDTDKNTDDTVTNRYKDLVDYYNIYGRVIMEVSYDDNIVKIKLPYNYYFLINNETVDDMKWVRYINQIPLLIKDMTRILMNTEIVGHVRKSITTRNDIERMDKRQRYN